MERYGQTTRLLARVRERMSSGYTAQSQRLALLHAKEDIGALVAVLVPLLNADTKEYMIMVEAFNAVTEKLTRERDRYKVALERISRGTCPKPALIAGTMVAPCRNCAACWAAEALAAQPGERG